MTVRAPALEGPKAQQRRQLPVYSPLPLAAVWDTAARVFGKREDLRPRLREFVRASYCADDVVLVGTGTQALQLAIRAASRLVGDAAVALPAFTCFDVASAAVGAGARIALYDLDPATLAPDPDSLAQIFAGGVRIVVAAPLYGIPIDWDALERCAATFGAVIIEDAAQGHGALWHDRALGSLGRLSVLSFGRGKGWTGGAGGALLLRKGSEPVSQNEDALEPLREPARRTEYRVLMAAAMQSAFARPSLYHWPAAIPWLHLGETRYHDPEPPVRMTRTAASLLENTREIVAREVLTRRVNAGFLLEWLPSRAMRPVCPPAGGIPGYLRLPVRASRGLGGFSNPSEVRRLGVMRSYPTSLAALPAVRERLSSVTRHWPGADELVRQLLTLPTHSCLHAEDRDTLAGLLALYVN